jgi:hypothetical protein
VQQPPAPGTNQSAAKKEPFYKQTWFVVLMMFLVPPLGIVLAWVCKKPDSQAGRIVLTVVSALIIIATISPRTTTQSDSTNSSQQSSSAATQQSQQSVTTQQTPAPTLTSIVAKYTGKTAEGVTINEKTSGLTVTGTYSDGSTKAVSEFKVANPAALVAGQTSTFTITAGDASCTLDIACTTLTADQFKQSCQIVDYESLARDPNAWQGKSVTVTGEVVQVQESSGGNVYRVSIEQGSYGTWQSSSTILVTTDSSYKGTRILEKDVVTIYGTSSGLYTYTTVMGASQTVPKVAAKYIDIG